MRDIFLRLATALGVALVATTELMGALGGIQRAPLVVAWTAVAAGVAVILVRRRPQLSIGRAWRDPVVLLCAAGCVAILAVMGAIAILSPPNSADAMAYHMPRVIYWAEQGSVRFFPTPYLNQIMLQPFAEYAMLQLYVLSGGDLLINLVQWLASATALLAVTLVAKELGAGARGRAMAALVAATVPAGILASSGAKNDYVLALWLVVAVYFALRFDAVFLGAAMGLALLTKATAYLFLPWLIGAVLITRRPRPAARSLALAGACALALNAPQFARNYQLSGSVLGFDSAQANGFYRWRNEAFGWKQTVSNAVRHLSEQLGARSPNWNFGVYRAALAIHGALRIDAEDPATTWRGAVFQPPVSANHEANAPNRWHLLLLIALGGLLAVRAARGAIARRRSMPRRWPPASWLSASI